MNFPVVICRLHGRCCFPPLELLFVLPGFQMFPPLPLLPPLRFPFLFSLLLPRPFSCPSPLLFFQLWCWLCICCCGWNGIWYVAGGTRLFMACQIICACCSCCCNYVLVAVNPGIVVWLLSNAEEKSCTYCSYAASAYMVAVSVALPPKPYCPAVTAQVRSRFTSRSKKLLLRSMFCFCLASHAIFHRMCWTGHI